jgi:hypothetical protein
MQQEQENSSRGQQGGRVQVSCSSLTSKECRETRSAMLLLLSLLRLLLLPFLVRLIQGCAVG